MMIRVSGVFIRVTIFLLNNQNRPVCGADIMKTLGLKSGTVYPLLRRVYGMGWIDHERGDIDPKKEGRPSKRRFYRMNALGQKEGTKIIANHH